MRRVAEESPLTRAVPWARGFRRAALSALSGAAAFFIASCATVPQRSPSEWLGVLPSDATLYASLSVPGSAALIKKALRDAGPGFQDVSTLIDMTKRLVCSVTLLPGAGASFSAAALGNYPSGIIGARLGGNKEWKKVSSPAGSWWEWTKAGLQMSIPNNGILLASNGGVEPLLGRWSSPAALRVPPDVADDMKSGDLVVYMPELPGGLTQNAAQNGVHIPVQEIWLKALKGTDGYEVSGTANTASERESRLLTLALRLGIVGWLKSENIPDASARLKAITVSAVGVQVKMAGLHVTEAEIIPLFLSLVKGLGPADGTPATPATPSPAGAAPAAGDAAG
jgi:hypothetical protein